MQANQLAIDVRLQKLTACSNSLPSHAGQIIRAAMNITWGLVLTAFCLLFAGGALDADRRHTSDAAFVILKVGWVFVMASLAAVIITGLCCFAQKSVLGESQRLVSKISTSSQERGVGKTDPFTVAVLHIDEHAFYGSSRRIRIAVRFRLNQRDEMESGCR